MQNNRIEQSLIQADWIVSAFEQLKPVREGRVGISMTYFYIVWQHQAAIPRLCTDGLFAPATALLRCALDAWVRGMWIHRVVSDDQFNEFIAGKRLPHIESMMSSLDKVDNNTSNTHKSLYDTSYSALCDSTHTGIDQIARHFDGETIVPKLTNEEIAELLIWAEVLALDSLSQAALISNNNEIAKEALLKLHMVNEEKIKTT